MVEQWQGGDGRRRRGTEEAVNGKQAKETGKQLQIPTGMNDFVDWQSWK